MNPEAQKMRVQRIRVRFLGRVKEESFQTKWDAAGLFQLA
jgi:hypothetical protein